MGVFAAGMVLRFVRSGCSESKATVRECDTKNGIGVSGGTSR